MWCHARPYLLGYRLIVYWSVGCYSNIICYHNTLFSHLILPPSGITLHSVFGQSQNFQILTKHIGKTINNYETK
jgi:hypothetical protein